MQTPSWKDISNNYSTEEEERPQESKAVVCDINKEMLKVGKQKGDSMGISAGKSIYRNPPGMHLMAGSFP